VPTLLHCAAIVPGHRSSLLVVGCGDVGLRVLRLVVPRWRALVLTHTPARVPLLRSLGAVPVSGDLDRPQTLARLASLATCVLHLAPPPADGVGDPRTRALVRALARTGTVRTLVYASTSGVYGDAGGARIDETRARAPATARARRRADAEDAVRWFGRAPGARVSQLRVPGIYANGRPGGDPRLRLRRGTPVLADADDVYTNHVHADDLARICVAALARGRPQRVVHASDDSELKIGEYFDLAADLAGLPRPPRLARSEAALALPAASLEFMAESRRLDNERLRRELRVALDYPTVHAGLAALRDRGVPSAPPVGDAAAGDPAQRRRERLNGDCPRQ